MHGAWTSAAIGFGSNVGEKADYIKEALTALSILEPIRVVAASRLYRTPPWGETDQPWFLNACALIETYYSPVELLDICKATEKAIGRQESYRWGPREIDIDILTYGGETMGLEGLTIPHRELMNRAFVLIPLAEIAPDMDVRGVRIIDAAEKLDGTGIEPDEAFWP